MKFLGITGGIGAGKSEVLKYIKEHYSCEIYLADEVAHEVKKSGTECFRQLVELLGEEILSDDGEIDKKKMAEKIFAGQDVLEQVNGLIHPAVKEYLLNRLEAARKREDVELFFVEAALLIETSYKDLVDEMWYIRADRDVRIRRLMENRGYTREKAIQIMANQLSEEEFLAGCDCVIDNSGALETAYEQIDKKLEAFTWHK